MGKLRFKGMRDVERDDALLNRITRRSPRFDCGPKAHDGGLWASMRSEIERERSPDDVFAAGAESQGTRNEASKPSLRIRSGESAAEQRRMLADEISAARN